MTSTPASSRHHYGNAAQLRAALQHAVARVAPVWPLESFVAVNPYLGLGDHSFAEAATRLEALAQARTTLPEAEYLRLVDTGMITQQHVQQALEQAEDGHGFSDAADILGQSRQAVDAEVQEEWLPLLVDAAGEASGIDCSALLVERVAAWAAAYFDAGQAPWPSADRALSPYRSWKRDAAADRSPQVLGLGALHRHVAQLPDDPLAAARIAIEHLDLTETAQELYLHALLLRLPGWTAFAARRDWEDRLAGTTGGAAIEMLAILLCWEYALVQSLGTEKIGSCWQEQKQTVEAMAAQPAPSARLRRTLVLQSALELAEQQRLRVDLGAKSDPRLQEPAEDRPLAQAVFCIDVRSEIYRRHLEAAHPAIETIGFAGFFGLPVHYHRLGHAHGNDQCPVQLSSTYLIPETTGSAATDRAFVRGLQLRKQFSGAWTAFKTGAVSCFGFVSPLGLLYLPKLMLSGLGIGWPGSGAKTPSSNARGGLVPDLDCTTQHHHPSAHICGMPLADRVAFAAKALKAMTLTQRFGRLVLIIGHGSSTVNNPHANGLDCGACGGHSGEANARITATILNDAEVRSALRQQGLPLPADTWFVACLHDTTTDAVTLLDTHTLPDSHQQDRAAVQTALDAASVASRRERAPRLGIAPQAAEWDIWQRSRDWAQVRPEWGLAGCSSFIVAPRQRTTGIDLGGRAFLHSYEWEQDADFAILELIMTAPMVVASWIDLQYYGSTVDNRLFGAGNKTLHNVVGTVGVLEGNGGDLRTGLPWQSVHDGNAYQHLPVRLSVLIEAPRDAIGQVLKKHADVRALCDNGWIHLFALDGDGQVSHRYTGEYAWEELAKDKR